MSAGAADITSNGSGSSSSAALYHQSFASPCTSASATSTCCSPRDWSTRAQARNTALVVFMLPPLPVANAITIGSRFFLSFIGFSLFRYVGIRFFGIPVSWFFGISVYAASHADRDGKRSEEAALDQALRHGFGRKEQRIVGRVFAARALAAFGPSPVVAAITAHAFGPVRMFGQPVTGPDSVGSGAGRRRLCGGHGRSVGRGSSGSHSRARRTRPCPSSR